MEKYWKDVVLDCKSFSHKGCKIAPQKKFFSSSADLALDLFGIGATIRVGREMLCLPYARFL